MKYMNRFLIVAVILTTIAVGCQKKDYFTNTGKHTPDYDGTVLDYLKSKPKSWDSLLKVIRIAGMENVFTTETITFFAPNDSCISNTIRVLNAKLDEKGQRRVTKLEQIKPEVWKKQLCRYLFKNAKRALSHGCVRVQEWEKLTYYISALDSSNYEEDPARVKSDSIKVWLERKEKHIVKVKTKLPVYFRYFTAIGKEGKLVFFEDIYHEDKQAREAYFLNK